MTVNATVEQQMIREISTTFALTSNVPPEIRETFRELLKPTIPSDVPAEHTGWVLHAVSAAFLMLAATAETQGIGQADKMFSPNLVGMIASLAEAMLEDATLADLDI